MNAEALTPPVDDVFDPFVTSLPPIRIRIPNPRFGQAVEEGQEPAPEFLHDATYKPAERRRSLTERVQRLETRLKSLTDDQADEAIGVLADMVEMLLANAPGLANVLRNAWVVDAISIEYLARITGWIQRQQNARVSAGEA